MQVSYIWSPQIVLNNAATAKQNYRLANDSTVEISSDGTIYAQMASKFETTCELDVKK